MKIILPASNYTYTPSLNRVDFSPMGAGFDSKRLLAIINIKTGKTIYATGSSDAGLGGTFSGSLLTYASSNAGQLASDPIQVFYDDEFAVQQVSGSVSIAGTVVVDEPVTVEGNLGAAKTVPSSIHDGSGTFPILSTPDPMTGRDGLDINLQSSSFGGKINNPLPLPYQEQALSVGFINGGNLVAPALDPVSNELQVQSTLVGVPDVNIASTTAPIQVDLVSNSSGTLQTDMNLGGVAASTGLGATGSATLRTSSNTAFAGISAATGAGATTTGTQRVVLANDAVVSTDLARFGGTSTSLGQKAMTASMPVVLASDQTGIDIKLPDLYINGAVNSAAGNNLFNAVAGPSGTDAQGYKSGAVQVIFTAAGGTVEFQHSSDNSTWVTMPVFRVDSSAPAPLLSGSGQPITAAISSNVYHFPIKMRYIRLNVVTTLSGTPRANLRLSQDSWAPIIPTVAQATAANLNATVAGSLTSVGTVTTVSTVTACSTVSTVTSSNTSVPNAASDIASAAITTTTTTAAFAPAQGVGLNIVIPVTATSGTGQTLDIDVQVSDDTAINWFTVYSFPRITATGIYRSPALRFNGNRIRYIQTVGGTSPSFTRAISRLNRSDTCPALVQFIDRTIAPNTLNSTSPTYFADGVTDFNIMVNCSAQTSAATIALQFSIDGTNWFTSATTVTTVVGIARASVLNEQWRFVRAIVTSAGSGVTLTDLTIKGVGR